MQRICLGIGVRVVWAFVSFAIVAAGGGAARAQVPANLPPENTSDNLIVRADRATTWVDPAGAARNVVQLEGNVVIELDRTRMTADRAVVWLSPTRGSLLEEQDAQIALLGNVALDQQNQVQRGGDRLFVTATVRGVVRVTADARDVGNRENSETYSIAYNWRTKSSITSSVLTLFSPSGDWAQYLTHYFRPDGTAAKVTTEMRTFNGDYIIIREMYFDQRGKLLKKSSKYLDLTTQKPKKPTKEMLVENSDFFKAEYYKKVSALPFYSLTKIK